jgi:hypothetical protein
MKLYIEKQINEDEQEQIPSIPMFDMLYLLSVREEVLAKLVNIPNKCLDDEVITFHMLSTFARQVTIIELNIVNERIMCQ